MNQIDHITPVLSVRPISDVVDHIEKSSNLLFITGRAGTGKSTLLRKLCDSTAKKYVVLAPTGVAAVDIRGETIHSFFGFKPGITLEDAEDAGRATENPIYRKLELIVIDEISMVRADLMDCIDVFLRRARRSDAPFGGVQMVLFGDLYQLEPVVTGDEKEALGRLYDSPYFFSANAFRQMLDYPFEQMVELVEMNTVYRQKDERFINMLDEIRKKKITDAMLYDLNRNVAEYIDYSMDDCMYITATNQKAREINARNLDRLGGSFFIVQGVIEGTFSEKNLPTDQSLYIKENARVMMLNNDAEDRWINGSLGTVTAIGKDYIRVLLDSGREYDVNQHTWSNYRYFFDHKTNTIKKEVAGTFTQFPIKLAWAITIHKSQGKTFDKVVICLGPRAFAHGQTYVALSRCRTLEGIILERPINQWDIMVDERVRKFLEAIKKYVIGWRMSAAEKRDVIGESIANGEILEITYLADDDTVTYRVKPTRIVGDAGLYTLEGLMVGHLTETSELSLDLDRIAKIEKTEPMNELSSP